MDDLGWCTAEPEISDAARQMALEINPLNEVSEGISPLERDDPRGDTVTVRQPLTGIGDKFWRPGSVLKVTFTNGSDAQRERVMNFAVRWSDHANIQFDVGEHADPDIRIAFDQDRHWSRVGTDSRLSTRDGDASMSFIGFNPSQGTVLHEFGHALGLKHEHQNPQAGINWDKQAVYDDLGGPPNNWSEDRVDANVFNKLEDESLNYSHFDPDSVMGYRIKASWTTDGFSTTRGNALSPTDISYIGDWYPFGGSPRPSRRPASNDVRVFTRGVSRRVFAKLWDGSRWRPSQEDWDLVLEGDISGHPGVSSWNPGDDAVLVVRGDVSGRPFVAVHERGRWLPWESLGGAITGSPTVVRTNTGEVWAFVRGVSGRPFFKRSSDGKTWNTSHDGWTSLGGGITGLVSAVEARGTIGLAVRGVSGRAFAKWWGGRSWSPGAEDWMNLDGAVTAQPAVAWYHGDLHVVVRFPGGEPQHRVVDVENGRVTGPWRPLGGRILGSPALTHGQDNRLHLIVRGTSRRVFRKQWDGQQWLPGDTWENLGGQSVDSPVAVALPRTSQFGARVQVFVTGVSRRGFRKVWDGNQWTPSGRDWEPLGGNLA